MLLITLPVSVARADSPGETITRSRKHFKAAEIQFSLGEFSRALAGYRKAFKLHPHPAILFNMAQCHRHLGNLKRSAFLLRRFLAKSPPKAQRSAAETILQRVEADLRKTPGRVGALASQPAAASQPSTAAGPGKDTVVPPAKRSHPVSGKSSRLPLVAVPPVTPGRAPTRTRPLYKRWWFWTIIGGALVATGTTIGVLASRGEENHPGTLNAIDYR